MFGKSKKKKEKEKDNIFTNYTNDPIINLDTGEWYMEFNEAQQFLIRWAIDRKAYGTCYVMADPGVSPNIMRILCNLNALFTHEYGKPDKLTETMEHQHEYLEKNGFGFDYPWFHTQSLRNIRFNTPYGSFEIYTKGLLKVPGVLGLPTKLKCPNVEVWKLIHSEFADDLERFYYALVGTFLGIDFFKQFPNHKNLTNSDIYVISCVYLVTNFNHRGLRRKMIKKLIASNFSRAVEERCMKRLKEIAQKRYLKEKKEINKNMKKSTGNPSNIFYLTNRLATLSPADYLL